MRLESSGYYNRFLRSKSAQNRHFFGKKRPTIFKVYFSNFTGAYFTRKIPDAQKNHEIHSLRSKLAPKKVFRPRDKNS